MADDMGTASGGGDPADPSFSDIGGEDVGQGFQTGIEGQGETAGTD